ncbi:response regulator, partial [Patescibacteria group bacterium]|nr:response regulator [Patescibacteria group bacterium]
MVVEDEVLLGEVLCDLLNLEGYETVYAENGELALQLIEEKSPDLVLTDLIMPKINGLELLSIMKDKYPDIGVIMLTAYGTVESSVQALKHGAFDYITKPYKEKEIMQCLERYFEQKKLKSENISLRKLNELKDKFLSLALHELNTPLMIIIGYLDMLIQDYTKDEIAKSYVHGAYNACERLGAIIAGMKLLTHGRSDLKLSDINLNLWLKEIYLEYITIVEKREQTLVLEIPEDTIILHADKNALNAIIRNLMSNAIKFTDNGGNIILGVKLCDDEIHIFCQDNGDGIPQKNIN